MKIMQLNTKNQTTKIWDEQNKIIGESITLHFNTIKVKVRSQIQCRAEIKFTNNSSMIEEGP